MSGKAMLTMNRSRLAMKTPTETIAQTRQRRVELAPSGAATLAIRRPCVARAALAPDRARCPLLVEAAAPAGRAVRESACLGSTPGSLAPPLVTGNERRFDHRTHLR